MPENANPLLQQLRDVHLPNEVGWWPLAPGWWLLMLVTALLLAWLLRKWLHWRQLNRYRKDAIAELNNLLHHWQQDGDTARYLQSAAAVLRRALLHLDGGKKSVSLTGQHWVAALHSYTKITLSDSTIEALTIAGYQSNPEVEVAHVNRQLVDWLRTHRQQPLKQQELATEARHA